MNSPTRWPEAAPLPPLRPDLEFSDQVRAGRAETVVRDPVNGSVYAFPQAALALLRRIDGVQSAQAFVTSAVGNDAAAQGRLHALLHRVQGTGLLGYGPPADALPAERKPLIRALWVLHERPLDRIAPVAARLLGPLLGPLVPLVLVLVAIGLWPLVERPAVFVEMIVQVVPTFPWWWLAVPLGLLSLLWHEAGHMVAAARHGARRLRGGLALFLLMPAAFVRVDDMLLIPTAWQRCVVSLAGLYFDLIALALCIWTWGHSPPFTLLNQTVLLLATFILARMSLNLLPFFRLDGYKALAEAVGIRQLRERAYFELLWLWRPLQPRLRPQPRLARSAAAALALYGVATLVFMLFLVWWVFDFFQKVFGGIGPVAALAVAAGASLFNAASLGLELRRDIWRLLRTPQP